MTSDQMFDVFWSEYPKRVAKKDAKKAWAKIKGLNYEKFELIIAAVAHQKRTVWMDKDSQFIPHAATWIRGERFEDEIPEEQHGQQKQRYETHGERVARVNREAGAAVDKILFGATGDGLGRDAES